MKKYLIGMIAAGLLVAAPVSAQTNDSLMASLLEIVSVLTEQVNRLQKESAVKIQVVSPETTVRTQVKETSKTVDEYKTIQQCVDEYNRCTRLVDKFYNACIDGVIEHRRLGDIQTALSEEQRCINTSNGLQKNCDNTFFQCAATADWGI